MSSRRKSTTPCMVLPSNMVEQVEEEEEEERMEVMGEGVTQGEEVGRKKSCEEDGEGAVVEEMRETVVVIAPTPPDTGHREPLASLKPGPAEHSLEGVLCGDGESAMLSEQQPCDAVPGVEALQAQPREEGQEQEEEEEQQVEEDQAAAAVAAISLSKTPIMRMKSKAEPKRIAVSLKSREEAADVFGTGLGGGGEGEEGGGEQEQPIEAPLGPMTPVEMLLQDSMRFGGGSLLVNLPPSEQQRKKSSALGSSVLPAGLAQVLSALQAQQSSAAAAAAAAVVQPQLLVPLSSIPSYSAAMDTNPLLGNTYKKFPYPSMAKIASLAAQTQFTEEQIKVWFSAQRLKHGVSWTPEEVEEARRKQFNGTVHTVPQTITVIPAHHLSAAANGLQSILQTCQIVGQHGLLFTQVGPGGNLPVTSPITLTVAGMPNQSQSAKGFSCQPSPGNSELKRATTVQPPSLSPQENSALSCDTFGMRPKKSKEQLAELKASYTKNQFASDAEIARLMRLTNLTKGEIKKWFSDTRYNQRNSKSSHVIVFHDSGGGRAGGTGGAPIVIDSSDEPTSPHPPPRTPPAREGQAREPRAPKTWNPFPDFTLQKFKEKTPEQLVLLQESFNRSGTPGDEELSRLRTETKLTRREIDAWFTERRKTPAAAATAPPCRPSSSRSPEGGQMDLEATGREGSARTSPQEPSSPSPSPSFRKGSQTPPGGRGKQSQDSRDKAKKSPEQLHILKSAFVRTQWPATEEYDRLAEESGLPRSYIVNWFGDSRYSWKNGNLKWFFQYQSGGGGDGLSCGGAGRAGGKTAAGGSNNGRKRRVRNRGWGRSRTRKQPKRSASELDRSPPLVKFKSGRDILKEYYLRHRFLNELDLDELVSKSNMSYEQVREWFAEVHRRVETGLDPFQNHGEILGKADEGNEESLANPAIATRGQTATAMTGDEVDEDDDEDDDEEDEEESDESEVWQPSRSVRKSLSGSED
ncbi:Zinc fingers and homeoboxes protein 1 [Merluccius polli]|uniref:Zinc fingers and homeoboxes protein 1 n=1 Tax=Merluccius polli TaxID=89951 RepID=A0AA47NCB4_MERPO|nr:Zinc fingers and homeoboxes protein 1 [Merluccius polli]